MDAYKFENPFDSFIQVDPHTSEKMANDRSTQRIVYSFLFGDQRGCTGQLLFMPKQPLDFANSIQRQGEQVKSHLPIFSRNRDLMGNLMCGSGKFRIKIKPIQEKHPEGHRSNMRCFPEH